MKTVSFTLATNTIDNKATAFLPDHYHITVKPTASTDQADLIAFDIKGKSGKVDGLSESTSYDFTAQLVGVDGNNIGSAATGSYTTKPAPVDTGTGTAPTDPTQPAQPTAPDTIDVPTSFTFTESDSAD